MRARNLLVALIIATVATVAAPAIEAAEERPILTAAAARTMIDACIARAESEGWLLHIAVTDNHGNLKAYHRMDDAPVSVAGHCDRQGTQLRRQPAVDAPVARNGVQRRRARGRRVRAGAHLLRGGPADHDGRWLPCRRNRRQRRHRRQRRDLRAGGHRRGGRRPSVVGQAGLGRGRPAPRCQFTPAQDSAGSTAVGVRSVVLAATSTLRRGWAGPHAVHSIMYRRNRTGVPRRRADRCHVRLRPGGGRPPPPGGGRATSGVDLESAGGWRAHERRHDDGPAGGDTRGQLFLPAHDAESRRRLLKCRTCPLNSGA